jgi:hypothetical protein
MKRCTAGFTLFEVILAIALAAVLLTLIGTAINLYLVQVDAGRTRVEEAQLARSILSMIADDIRGTTVYKPQDTSGIAQLMAKSAAFNVDDVDKTSSGSGVTRSSAAGTISGATAVTSAAAATTSSSSSGSTDGSDTDTTLPLGLTGSLEELYVDATRLPKQEELFATTTGYTNAQSPTASSGATSGNTSGASQSGVPATDLKTVHYFVRPGDAVETGSASVTSLDPAAQAHIGGLVRQEIPRAMRNFAEKNGGSSVLDSNQVLLAPEVVHMEFHFFNGSDITDTWDMKEQKSLPAAVEVRIWLRSPSATSEPVATTYDTATLTDTTHEYRQVVYLPMAQLAKASQSTTSTDSSSTDSSSSGNGSSSETGSSFDQAQ